MSTSCKSFSPFVAGLSCQEIDPDTNTVTWNFTENDYTDGSVPPGTYTFVYEVSSVEGVPLETFNVVLTVTDPCENETIAYGDLSDIQFTISESDRTLERLFTFGPEICSGSGLLTVMGAPDGIQIDTFVESQAARRRLLTSSEPFSAIIRQF